MKDEITIPVSTARIRGGGDTGSWQATLTREQVEDALAELNKPDLPKPGDLFSVSSKFQGSIPGQYLAVNTIMRDLMRAKYPTLDVAGRNVWSVDLRKGSAYEHDPDIFTFHILPKD